MSRRRRLRPDEQELWDQVRQTAEPLHPERNKHQIVDDADWLPRAAKKPPRPVDPDPVPTTHGLKPFQIGAKSGVHPSARRHDLAPAIEDHVSRAPLNMDKKAHTRLKRGKLSPEARIDLHGMTLAQAHPALIGFILRAHAAGQRLVLVITGKGKDRDQPGPIPERYGALRHNVPHWLDMPPLASMILQVRQAHIRHGGGGAYYVYLRKGRGL